MPIMLRPNDKAKKIAEKVMDLAQQYGEEVENIEIKSSFFRYSPSERSKKNNIDVSS